MFFTPVLDWVGKISYRYFRRGLSVGFGNEGEEMLQHPVRDEDGFEGFTVVEGVLADRFDTLSEPDLVQVDAALEGPGADVARGGRNGDLLQVPAVAEGILADVQETLRELDGFKVAAFVESGAADVREGGGQVDFLQEGVPFVQRDLFADFPVLGHVVLEGEDAVAKDPASFPDRDGGRKVLRVEEFAPVRGIGAAVFVVPNIAPKFFRGRNRGDAEDFFEGHIRSS